jgi:hypothetical protein
MRGGVHASFKCDHLNECMTQGPEFGQRRRRAVAPRRRHDLVFRPIAVRRGDDARGEPASRRPIPPLLPCSPQRSTRSHSLSSPHRCSRPCCCRSSRPSHRESSLPGTPECVRQPRPRRCCFHGVRSIVDRLPQPLPAGRPDRQKKLFPLLSFTDCAVAAVPFHPATTTFMSPAVCVRG